MTFTAKDVLECDISNVLKKDLVHWTEAERASWVYHRLNDYVSAVNEKGKTILKMIKPTAVYFLAINDDVIRALDDRTILETAMDPPPVMPTTFGHMDYKRDVFDYLNNHNWGRFNNYAAAGYALNIFALFCYDKSRNGKENL